MWQKIIGSEVKKMVLIGYIMLGENMYWFNK